MAGAEGIEPSSAVLETDVLPLNHAPKKAPDFAPLAHTQPDILSKNSTTTQKIKCKYYKFFWVLKQGHFSPHITS